jgi:DnaK suppressor protein
VKLNITSVGVLAFMPSSWHMAGKAPGSRSGGTGACRGFDCRSGTPGDRRLMPIKVPSPQQRDHGSQQEPRRHPMTSTITTLTAGQRADLKARLLYRQAELDGRVAEQQAGAGRVDMAADLLNQEGDDAPQRDADREVALARADHELEELGQVSRALRRLAEPDFGACADCGEAIAIARLQLEPWALRCVACESAHEGPAVAHHARI